MAGEGAFSVVAFSGEAFVRPAPVPAFSRAFSQSGFKADAPTVQAFSGSGFSALAFVAGAAPARAFSGSAFSTAAFNATPNGALPVIPGVDVSLVGLYPAPSLSAAVVYVSGAARPLAGTTHVRYEPAARTSTEQKSRLQDAVRLPSGVAARHQDAAALPSVLVDGWQDSARLRDAAVARYQQAMRLAVEQAGGGWQDAMRTRVLRSGRFQRADRVPVAPATGRFQQAQRQHRASGVDFQQAGPVRAVAAILVVQATARPVGLHGRYQDAAGMLAGFSEHPVHPPGTVDPEPGETIVVPIRRAYIVKNTITLTRVEGGDAIPASAFTMSIDADSWSWQWSATLPGGALPLIESTDGHPVDVLATINGVGYRLCVERYTRERRFASSKISVSGRGRAAILDAPYAPVLNHVGDSGMTIAQLLDKVLTINGVGIGWSVDFGIDDWFVPANSWTLQGSYIAGVLDVAGAAGAIVQPHRTDPTLRILPRYPAAPWHWGDVTPDFELPAAAVAVEGIEWVTRPDYNRVFVMGSTSGGVTGQVTRAGTAGDVVAPQVTHSLITHVDGARQRGLPELANTGRQAQVALRLQVLPETGIIVPGQFVRYVDGGETRMGLVRGTSLDGFPQLRQSITLETHLEEA